MSKESFARFLWSHLLLCAMLLLVLSPTLSAQSLQSESSRADQLKTRQVFAAASEKLIRFTSLGELIQMRLEVIGSSGEMLFDSDFKSANVIDWPLSDKQGQQFADGSYLCVVTVKDSSGRITGKLALARLHDQSVSLRRFDVSLLSAAQAEAAGASSSEDMSLTILEPGQSSAGAVLAHDGSTAHLASGSGGLSISSGDFFASKALEHVRLTAEGNLGIGVANPQAKLDVAGQIRASDGIVFPDGSIQFSAASKTLGAKSVRADRQQKRSKAGQEHIEPQATGTGTQNRLAKWMDNAGTLGNSSVTDTGYLAIDSNSNPLIGGSGSLIIQGNSNKERVELRSAGAITGPTVQGRGFGGTITAPTATQASHNLFIIGGSGHNGSDIVTFNAGVIKLMAEENWTGTANGAYINFETTPSGSATSARAERMRITGSGNVGIGTSTPADKLVVNGNIHATRTNLFAEGFESVTFPPAGWTTGGSANWVRDTSTFYQGSASAAINLDLFDASSFLDFDFTAPVPGYVRFFWKAVARTNATFLLFCLDNDSCSSVTGYNQRITGNVDWSEVKVPVSAGLHSFRWVLTTTTPSFAGEKGWLDNLRFTTAGGNIITDGNLVADDVFTTGSVGIGTATPLRRLDVNGVVGVFDNNTRSFNAGIATEASAQLIDFGMNDDSVNRFGGSFTAANQGGFLRVDGRAGQPLFGFFGRTAGTNGAVAELGSLSSGGTVRFEIGSGQKFSLGGNGSFEIDAPGTSAGRFVVTDSGNVGVGTAAPSAKLTVNGIIRVETLGSAGGTALCYNASNEISTCSSSRRYKDQVLNYSTGLNALNRLRPVAFRWKESGEPDLGLVAEEVEKIEPLLVTYNSAGHVEGVKYDRINVVLMNAVKQQQEQIKQQQSQIEALKKLVCLDHPNAAICK